MLLTYSIVGAGFLIGAYFGFFVIEYDPPIMGWFFGTGTGLALGAFLAALVSNTPLAGNANKPQRRGVIPRDLADDDLDDPYDWYDDEEEPRGRAQPRGRDGTP